MDKQRRVAIHARVSKTGRPQPTSFRSFEPRRSNTAGGFTVLAS